MGQLHAHGLDSENSVKQPLHPEIGRFPTKSSSHARSPISWAPEWRMNLKSVPVFISSVHGKVSELPFPHLKNGDNNRIE